MLGFSSSVQALQFFYDQLYWKATESIDWVYRNDLGVPNQTITYKTIQFNSTPAYRVGLRWAGGPCLDDWGSTFFYTHYQKNASDSATGNLVSTFLGGKLVQGSGLFFYQSGQIGFKINYNLFDWDVSKRICLSEDLILYPAMGLKAGTIKQKVITTFQGPVSIVETVQNNFRGFGPKIGLEGKWTFYRQDVYQFSLVSDFTTSYLWGRWAIRDITLANNGNSIDTKDGKRRIGAYTIRGMIGVNLDYHCFAARLGYELEDWFNQYQILDDGTGAQNKDLVLQGLTLRLSYDF